MKKWLPPINEEYTSYYHDWYQEWFPIFEPNGSFHPSFIATTNLNTFYGDRWEFEGVSFISSLAPSFYMPHSFSTENVITSIRFGHMPSDIRWNANPIPMYATIDSFQSLFQVEITFEDVIKLDSLVGFYRKHDRYGDYLPFLSVKDMILGKQQEIMNLNTTAWNEIRFLLFSL